MPQPGQSRTLVLAIDRGNQPHIAEWKLSVVRYWHRGPTGWTSVDVDSNIGAVDQLDIAVSSDGVAYIVYRVAATKQLRLATQTSDTTFSLGVVTTTDVPHPSVTVDTNGAPVVAYVESGKMKVATRSGSAFQIDVAGNTPSYSQPMSQVLVGPDGDLHVFGICSPLRSERVATTQVGPTSAVGLADGRVIATLPIDKYIVGTTGSFKEGSGVNNFLFASPNRQHVYSIDGYRGVRKWNGNGFDLVLAMAPGNAVLRPAVAVTNDGVLHILASDGDGKASYQALTGQTLSPKATVLDAVTPYTFAVDPAGNLHAFFAVTHNSFMGSLKIKKTCTRRGRASLMPAALHVMPGAHRRVLPGRTLGYDGAWSFATLASFPRGARTLLNHSRRL